MKHDLIFFPFDEKIRNKRYYTNGTICNLGKHDIMEPPNFEPIISLKDLETVLDFLRNKLFPNGWVIHDGTMIDINDYIRKKE